MAAASLEGLYRRLLAEYATLATCFSVAASPPPTGIRTDLGELAAEMVVLRTYDAWARFCRSLIVASAGYRPLDSTGARLPLAAGIHSHHDVIPHLLATYKNRRHEPRWADATEAIDAAQRLRISNFTIVAAALGSATSPADDIRVLRNFFAHRAKDTADEVRRRPWYAPNTPLTARDLPAQVSLGGISLYHRWVIELQAIAQAASR